MSLINTILIEDLISLIIKTADDYHSLLVCKTWYDIILKNSTICPTCNKVIKMYDTTLWNTDVDDGFCHGYYGYIEDYKNLKFHMFDIRILKNFGRQCYGLCLAAVKRNARNLEYVTNQTEELCLIAVNACPDTIKYVKNQTEKICLKAIEINPVALQFISEENQTENVCLQAVRNNGDTLKYVINQTDFICLEAVRSDVVSLRWMMECNCNNIVQNILQNQRIYKCNYCDPIRNKNNIFHLVKNKTEEICLAAIDYNENNLQYAPIDIQTEIMCLIAVNKNGLVLEHIANKTHNVCLAAVRNNGMALRFISNLNKTEDICLEAINNNWCALKYVPEQNQTDKICQLALEKDKKAFVYIKIDYDC